MFTVRIKKISAVKAYSFICARCKIGYTQSSAEATMLFCPKCFLQVPDIRGLIEKPQFRIKWHKLAIWEP
jgi:hypothetical protein